MPAREPNASATARSVRFAAIVCAVLLPALFLFLVTSAAAAEKQQVCARYRTSAGWSHSYSVEATLTTGSELNTATRSFNYSSLSKYVVIFWDKGEASVIELDFPYLNAVGTDGVDQEGRKWEISTGSVCI